MLFGDREIYRLFDDRFGTPAYRHCVDSAHTGRLHAFAIAQQSDQRTNRGVLNRTEPGCERFAVLSIEGVLRSGDLTFAL